MVSWPRARGTCPSTQIAHRTKRGRASPLAVTRPDGFVRGGRPRGEKETTGHEPLSLSLPRALSLADSLSHSPPPSQRSVEVGPGWCGPLKYITNPPGWLEDCITSIHENNIRLRYLSLSHTHTHTLSLRQAPVSEPHVSLTRRKHVLGGFERGERGAREKRRPPPPPSPSRAFTRGGPHTREVRGHIPRGHIPERGHIP